MDYKMPNTFIIIKGQPKALQIERFQMGNNGVYEVKFKSSPRCCHTKRRADIAQGALPLSS